MRRASIALVAVATLVLGAGAAVAADGDEAEPLRIEAVDLDSHPQVTLTVGVPPALVGAALDDADFTVTEDGVARPVEVEALPADDLRVVLVLDTSGSMEGDPLVAEKGAAARFLETMPPGVQVALVRFDSSPSLITPFTDDLAQVAADVDALPLGGNTALYDAVVLSAAQFETAPGTRKAIVLLSDGGDTASGTPLDEARSTLAAANASFYAVELQSPENDSEALAALADAAGGVVVAADDPEALESIFAEVAAEIVNQYTLTYTTEASGATTVAVRAESDGVVATGERSVRFPIVAPPTTLPVEPTPAPAPAPPETTPAPAPSIVGSLVTLSWLETRPGLYAGLAAVFVAIAALILFTGVADRQKVGLIAADARQRFSRSKSRTLATLADQATLFAERRLERGGRAGRINRLLERAGLNMRPGELVVFAVCLAIGAAVVGLFLAGPVLALVSAGLVFLLARLWISRRAEKRSSRFAEQLPDCLQLISGSLRAGFGLMQAIETVGQEMPSPAGEEFRRVKVETHLGKDPNLALSQMAERVGSEDFAWIVDAIEIHREVGGDLGDIIDSVHDTIRDRNRVRRRVRSLSAEGRISGVILSLLPFAMTAFILVVNPRYLEELYTTTVGLVMVGSGLVALVVGVFWMRRITDLKY